MNREVRAVRGKRISAGGESTTQFLSKTSGLERLANAGVQEEARTRVDPKIQSILDKALAGDEIGRDQAMRLVGVDERSPDMYAIMSAANSMTRRQYSGRGEVWKSVV